MHPSPRKTAIAAVAHHLVCYFVTKDGELFGRRQARRKLDLAGYAGAGVLGEYRPRIQQGA